MRRGPTGHFELTAVGGEQVRAFLPAPLPPEPALNLTGRVQLELEQALVSLGRLDSITTLLPDTSLFLYMYVRKEAVLSSQIEGTQSSLSDLLLFELEQSPGAPIHDVVEVSNYVAALDHGLRRLRDDFPLSNRLIREIHGVLMSRGRGSDKDPGSFRRSQNWIGGSRPGLATYVPPPTNKVLDCMSDLERFLHDRESPLPILVKAALAHVQFETIHPFLDGNGRVGRLLIPLVLCQAGILAEPLLYLSLYLKQHRADYFRLLGEVRDHGTWEAWIEFFVDGVRQTADGAVASARRLMELLDRDRSMIQTRGRATGSALRVHHVLVERPIVSLVEVTRRAELSFPAATTGMNALVELGIARELTGKKRNRVFGYEEYLEILSEGTEPL